jgi:hypothetical protein
MSVARIRTQIAKVLAYFACIVSGLEPIINLICTLRIPSIYFFHQFSHQYFDYCDSFFAHLVAYSFRKVLFEYLFLFLEGGSGDDEVHLSIAEVTRQPKIVKKIS